MEESTKGRLLCVVFHPIGAGVGEGCETWKSKRHAGVHPLCILMKFSGFMGHTMILNLAGFAEGVPK